MHKTGKDFIGVSAGAVITNDGGKYFLAKRSSKARDDQGTWEFPGGSVLVNETREQAALRNILEKYGMKVGIKNTLGVYDVIDRSVGDHWLSTTYQCTHISGEPKINKSDKCDDIGWFSIKEIQKLPLSRITKLNLNELLKTEH